MAATQTKKSTIKIVGKSRNEFMSYACTLNTPFQAVGSTHVFIARTEEQRLAIEMDLMDGHHPARNG